MLVVLPVRTVLLYVAMSLSTYSTVTFLFAATPLEIQMVSVLLNLCTVGMGMYLAFQVVPALFAKMEGMECRCEDASTEGSEASEAIVDDSASDASKHSESLYVQTDRRVIEREGILIVTTTYKPVDEVEEVREMVEKSPLQESPTEETTEFAELLKKD